MKFLLPLITAFLLGEASLALVQRKPFSTSVRPASPSRSRSMSMYFDDITDKGIELEYNNDNNSYKTSISNQTYGEQKAEAVKKYIVGHDPTSALKLGKEGMEEELAKWAVKSALIDSDFVKGEYESLSNVSFCYSKSVTGSLVHIWEKIVEAKKNQDTNPSQMSMVVLPECKELYNYENMALLQTSLTFAKDLCESFGHTFTLKVFHPKYKNEPKFYSPARHSPFPAIGFEFKETEEWRQSTSEDNIDKIFNPELLEQRQKLEDLFKLSAFFDDEEETKPLAFESKTTPEEAIHVMKEWIDGTSESHPSIPSDDTWWITDSSDGEETYLAVWSAIRTLEGMTKYETKSMFMVLPNFLRTNAPTFKRFAISVNATLKRMTGGQFTMDLYHPEYVGANVKDEAYRRSPYPAIQINYRKR